MVKFLIIVFSLFYVYVDLSNGKFEFIDYIIICTNVALLGSRIYRILNSIKEKKEAEARWEEFKKQVHGLKGWEFGSLKEFTVFRKKIIGLKIEGCYLIKNKNTGWYYVGQSVDILGRVNQHVTGHGNGDVYADIKYGAPIMIKLIPLENSGFDTLNSLERSLISVYGANYQYNKTRGNRG